MNRSNRIFLKRLKRKRAVKSKIRRRRQERLIIIQKLNKIRYGTKDKSQKV